MSIGDFARKAWLVIRGDEKVFVGSGVPHDPGMRGTTVVTDSTEARISPRKQYCCRQKTSNARL